MPSIKYYLYRVLSSIAGNEWLIKYYRRLGITIGDDTHIFSRLPASEPYLIAIGDHTTIATNVLLITHDASIGALGDRKAQSDLCGRITIGNHCFIGAGSILLPGISIPDGVVVGAGSVVVKSIDKSDVIVAGNPARIVGNTEDFVRRNKDMFFSLHGLSFSEKKSIILSNEEKLLNK